jgi:hypothetical protein
MTLKRQQTHRQEVKDDSCVKQLSLDSLGCQSHVQYLEENVRYIVLNGWPLYSIAGEIAGTGTYGPRSKTRRGYLVTGYAKKEQ